VRTADILAKLEGVQGGDGRWIARCPAHEDNRQSLALTEADGGKTLLHCHAGCSSAAVVLSMGLSLKDLFADSRNGSKKPAKRFVAAYDYTDADGKLIYQAVRYEPKNFSQRRPDGNGGWTYKLSGVQPLPYRLPKIIAAAKAGGEVFVVEGEKDVHSLEAIGLVATCNSGGAGKWKPGFGKFLAGARVVILPDNDQVGEEHAQSVAASAHGKAASIRIVRLPDLPAKGDVSDWLAAGGAKEALLEFVAAAEEWSPTTIESPDDDLTTVFSDEPSPEELRVVFDPQDGEPCDDQAAPGDDAPKAPRLDDDEGRTELANARRLLKRYGRDILHCHAWRKWLVWGRTHWEIDRRGSVARKQVQIADALWRHVAFAEDEKERKELIAYCKQSASRRGVENAVALAAFEVSVDEQDLDAHPLLLNVRNGTLDLETGKLREPDRADLITKLCPTEYDPNAYSDDWEEFTTSTLPDPDVRVFIQRLCGYLLTGSVQEQILPIFWGGGANGKSTLVAAIREVMGPAYAMTADKSLLLVQKFSGHSTERMDLFGKRAVFASETEEGEKFAESFVKQLTGGGNIRGRRMREDAWEFKATHKILLETNAKPEVSGQDHAIWRRLRLVPFTQTFWDADKGESGPLELKQNKRLTELFKGPARPAILAWMVRGCRDWLRDGLTSPAAVIAATADYQTEQDKLAAFLEECCVQFPQCKVKAAPLYDGYRRWSESNGERPWTNTLFGKRIRQKFTSIKSNGVWYCGLALKDDREGLA